MARIIIIEDDKQLGALVKTYFESFKHTAAHFLDPLEGLASIKEVEYDLLILDVMLPNMNGFEVLEELRKNSALPVIMLTARGDVSDKITGLELGADDYLPKPFEPRELLARVDAILRRSTKALAQEGQDEVQFKNLKVFFSKREVTLDNTLLDLTTAEFELLEIFIKNRGRVLSRDDIMNELQGIDSNVFSRSIDISVSRLRQKLGDSKKEANFIKTIWGKGYMFVGEESEA